MRLALENILVTSNVMRKCLKNFLKSFEVKNFSSKLRYLEASC
eukprot:UN21048